jgi:N-formylglutamate deformylase
MSEIKKNTFLNIDLFKDEFEKTLIFHIPHSSINIPNRQDYLISSAELSKELIKLTDLSTDLIFDLGPDITKMVFPYNRLYCDVERLPDEQEVMYAVGRGFYYTKTDDGRLLRNEKDKEQIRQIYNEHHLGLQNLVQDKLDNYTFACIIDCHSFSDTPFDTDLDKTERPDICLGTDEFHTPRWLIKFLTKRFESIGLTVKVNSPYSGTIVPLNFYKQTGNVISIMIEINRKLFMENDKVDFEKVIRLNTQIKKIFIDA